MRVTHRGNVFVASLHHERERAIVRRAGFWHHENQWVTVDPRVAARVRDHFDEWAEEKLRVSFIARSPFTGRIPYPRNLRPLPFQIPAAKFALERNHSYLAVDPGGGKTIIAALVLNALGEHPVVILVPPSLAVNWEAELDKWITWRNWNSVLIVPDSIIADPFGEREELFQQIRARTCLGGATLIVDEAHRYKTLEAQRTVSLLGDRGLWRLFDRTVMLSGTPMPNRPMELFPVLNRFAPETIGFRRHHDYGVMYCGAWRDHWGWKYDRATNVDQLAKNVHGTYMLRLRKKDILKDLGPKTEEVVMLSGKTPSKIVALEKQILRNESPEDLMKHLASNGHTSTYRRMIGLAKVPLVIAFYRDLLEDTGESVLLFAEHIEVVDKLRTGLARFNPVVVSGATPKKDRQKLVNAFQRDPKIRVFIGNMKAAGVGFTLTKAQRVGLVEPSWVPAENDQASDRAHRIGQEGNVLVQYFCFRNSLDRAIIETNLRKKQSTRVI